MQRKLGVLPSSLIATLQGQYLFRGIQDQVLISCLQGVEELHILKDELISEKENHITKACISYSPEQLEWQLNQAILKLLQEMFWESPHF